MTLSTQVITLRTEFNRLSAEWNTLLHRSAADSIFLTFEWLSSWLDVVYPQANLFVITLRDKNNELVAIAPFYITEFKFLKIIRYRYLRFIGDCHTGAEYPDIIIKTGLEENALARISQEIEKNQDWQCVWLPNISGWSGSCERLTKCFGSRLSFIRNRPISFSNLKLPLNFSEYLDNLSRSHRTLFLRQERKLQRDHSITFHVCQDREEIKTCLDNLFHLHALRWQRLGQEGSFNRRPSMVDFYQKFAPIALKNNWLGLFTLKVDGEVQAAQYGYLYQDTFYQLQEGFNPQGAAGIGNTLRLQVIKWCIKAGIKDYDFLGDHTTHKANWGSQERSGANLFLGKRSIKNRLLSLQEIWPTGRYIDQGIPANPGKNH